MINHVLRQNNTRFRDLLTRVKRLEAIQQLVYKHIDPNLAKFIQVASYEDGCLKFVTSSATWATPLRYAFPQLIQILKSYPQLRHLQRCDCQIRPPDKAPTPPTPPPNLSAQTRDLLHTAASGIMNEALRDALKRLARNDDD